MLGGASAGGGVGPAALRYAQAGAGGQATSSGDSSEETYATVRVTEPYDK